MQTTLLALAIAIILALLTALVGPLLIDWSGHRTLFEAEASRLIGVNVRVTGEIDARLLPSPRLTLHAIEVGTGGEKILARSLGIEFSLGPLMRGDWRASELHLEGPQISLGLDASGHVQAPNIAVAFNPDGLAIDRLSIEDGKVVLADAANGAAVTLDKLWFNGEARSLLGPFKGEGAVRVGGELYPFRLTAGRYSDDGAAKIHVNVDPVNHPLSIEADGLLSLGGGEPRFDGTMSLARPVGIASRGAAAVTQPWRVGGKIKAAAAAALLQDLEFQYGSEEQGLKLTGVAEFKFGARPRFDGVLSGRQIDLDRVLTPRDGRRLLPATALRELAELGGGAFRPTIPIQIGVGIDQIALGGNTIQNVGGDISSGAGGWNLDRFEIRAPGFTQMRLSGRLAVDADGVAFTGPAEIQSGDPKALAAWLEGRPEPEQGDLRPLNLRGDVTVGREKIAVERLKIEFDRKTVTGGLAYVFAAGNNAAKLDATLNAPELDIDAVLGFGKAVLAGSNMARPHDMTLAVDIDRATFGGVVARNASARIKVDAQGLQIDKLAVADLGGGSLSASGRIDTGGRAPRGSLALDFESRQTAAIAALVQKFVPGTELPAAVLGDRVGHAKLHATLDVSEQREPAATLAQLAVTGAIDAMNVAVRARVGGDWQNPAGADVRVDGTLDAPDGAALVRLLGLDRYLVAGKGAGQLKLSIAGPAEREQTVELRLTADGLNARSIGRGRVSLDKGLVLNSTLEVTKVNLRPLRSAVLAGSGDALPFSLNARLALAGRAVSFEDFNARLGQSNLRGALSIDGGTPRRIGGTLNVDTVDAMAPLAAAIGMPAPPAGRNSAAIWSSEPFAGGIFGDYAGEVALKVGRLDVLPQITAREFRATLRFGKDEVVVDDMTGELGAGRLAGRLAFGSAGGGLTARATIALVNADAAGLLPAAARPPITGSLALDLDLAGAGLSPVALIGSLQGAGRFTLANGEFAALDPRAFDAVIRAVDQGLAIDAGRIATIVSRSLDSGQLSVQRVTGTIAVSAGQARLNDVAAESKDAALSVAGNVDLTDGSIDARLVLSGTTAAAGARPDIFMALKGPLATPARSIDVSALTGWLTLRAVENQAKKLQSIEDDAKRARAIEEEARRLRQIENENKRRAIENEARRLRESESALPRAGDQAPVLPPPVEVRPLPAPARNRPQPSFGPQN